MAALSYRPVLSLCTFRLPNQMTWRCYGLVVVLGHAMA